jgi:hypothetical protein
LRSPRIDSKESISPAYVAYSVPAPIDCLKIPALCCLTQFLLREQIVRHCSGIGKDLDFFKLKKQYLPFYKKFTTTIWRTFNHCSVTILIYPRAKPVTQPDGSIKYCIEKDELREELT